MGRLMLLIVFLFSLQFVEGQDNLGLMFGGTDNDIGTAICHINDGGFLLIGTTRSYGNGSEDIYLIKIDENYQTVWEKTIGWTHSDIIRSVIEINDGFLLSGEVWDYGMAGYDICLIKISKEGELLWKKFYGSHSLERGMQIKQKSDSSLILLGYSRIYDNKGDVVIVKTDKDGEEIWRNNYSFGYDDYGFDLTLDIDENIIVYGTKNGFFNDVHANYKNHDADYFLLKVNDEGNEIQRKTFGGDGHDFGSAIIINEDNLICVGSSQSDSYGSFDLTINILDEDMTILSSENYGGSDYEYGTSITLNSENEYFVLGTSKSFGINNTADVYLLKFDVNNSLLWQTTFGGPGVDYGKQLVTTSDGGCVVICESNSFEDGSFNLLFVKINGSGEIENIIDNIDSNYLKNIGVIHPNPISGSGRLIVENNRVEYIVQFYSITGGKITEMVLTPPSLRLNVDNLPSGAYAYRIFSKENSTKVYSGILIVN